MVTKPIFIVKSAADAMIGKNETKRLATRAAQSFATRCNDIVSSMSAVGGCPALDRFWV
jgi:hypothetical protein